MMALSEVERSSNKKMSAVADAMATLTLLQHSRLSSRAEIIPASPSTDNHVHTSHSPQTRFTMSQTCAMLARRANNASRFSLRAAQKTTIAATQQHMTVRRRWQSTEAVAATNPKIASIVDQIGSLTLLETADLVSTLKVGAAQSDTGIGY